MTSDSLTSDQIRLLADPRNRAVVTTLHEADEPLHVDELTERLVDSDVGVVSAAEYEDRIERELISLHHDRLPKLAAANLIEYDPETNLVTERSSPTADVEWLDGTGIEALTAPFHSGHDSVADAVGVIDGRESILQYGRKLADDAERELFCVYVTTDLLEDECVRRARAALERGVTMYLGSQNAEVRALTRNRLPEATVWEPQLDWSNSATYPRIGRLVLADRRRVMLAVLDAPPSEDEETHPEETAVVADGDDHPLVVLVRELLGQRLDHLDYQSDDFGTALPSYR